MQEIEVIGLGAGDINQLPLGIYRTLIKTDKKVYVRTKDHPVVHELEKEGVQFHSFDELYTSYDQFDKVYEAIVEHLLQTAENAAVLYAVPGHPMLAERTVQLLLQQEKGKIQLTGGQSYLDAMFAALRIDPIEGFQFVDATDFNRSDLSYKQHTVFCQVYDAFIASEVKLTLLEDLPADYPITVVEAVGTAQERIETLPLEELDRMDDVSNVTSVYIPPVSPDMLQHTFSYLCEVMKTLRGPGGCPWDKQQTHSSLRKYLLEETYELIDAIETEDEEAMIAELGDVLLQVMLHSQIGADEGYFTIDDVIRGIVKKMIHRHPHVFGNGDDSKSWDTLKAEENPSRKSLVDGVIWQAPALEIAEKIQHQAAKIGFDWKVTEELWDNFEEEKQECKHALEKDREHEAEAAFGDMLFVLASIGRHYHIQPELALNRTNRKYYKRFSFMEEYALENSQNLKDMTLEELHARWEMAKREE